MFNNYKVPYLIGIAIFSMSSAVCVKDSKLSTSEFRNAMEAQFHEMLEEVDAMDHSSAQYKA